MTMSKWLTHFSKSEEATFRLVCFPHAGGGAAAYYRLAKLMPNWLEVVAVVPPGREARIREAFADGIQDMARGAVEALTGLPPRPQVFFGHSMGAMIAFEAGHMLSDDSTLMPRRLFLSGRRAHGPLPWESPISELPPDKFVAQLSARYGGIPQQIINDSELLNLFLPVIRADIRAIERHPYIDRPPLGVSATLIGGHDDPQCTNDAWDGWKAFFSGDIEYLRFPGDHFYLVEQAGPLAAALLARILRVHG